MKFPNTPSFIVGFSAGASSIAFFAQQPGWWMWIAIGIVTTFYATVRMVIDKRKAKDNDKIIIEALEQSYSEILWLMNYGRFDRKIEFNSGYLADAISKLKSNGVDR